MTIGKSLNLSEMVSLFIKLAIGNSRTLQWLGLGAFTAGARVQSLIGELRSRKLHGVAPQNKN